MVLGNRFVRRVTTEVNTVDAASLMKDTEPNSQHLFSQKCYAVRSCTAKIRLKFKPGSRIYSQSSLPHSMYIIKCFWLYYEANLSLYTESVPIESF